MPIENYDDWLTREPVDKPLPEDREDTRPDHPSDYGAYCRPWGEPISLCCGSPAWIGRFDNSGTRDTAFHYVCRKCGKKCETKPEPQKEKE